MDKKLVFLIFVFLLIFASFTGSLLLSRDSRDVRASKRIVDPTKSLCLASSLSAKIGESTTVTCVARDQETHGVSGAQCCFTITSGTGTTTPNCETTDQSGMAKTTLSSTIVGTTQINCRLNDTMDAGTVSVAFSQ